MQNFIKAETTIQKEAITLKKIGKFIAKFNSCIKKGEETGDGAFHLNDGLDNIPTLNDSEFNYCIQLALLQGWILTQFNDNYQSITYKMKKRIN